MTAAEWRALEVGPQTGHEQAGSLADVSIMQKANRQRRRAGRMWATALSEARRVTPGGQTIPRGMVDASSQWVRMLTVLEPGRWYGASAIKQLAGLSLQRTNKQIYKCVDRGLNPRFNGHAFCHGQGAEVKGKHYEPRILYRLNARGEKLRQAALEKTEGWLVFEPIKSGK